MKRLSTSVTVLLVVFAALMFGAADRARADTIYYAGIPNGSTWNFWHDKFFGRHDEHCDGPQFRRCRGGKANVCSRRHVVRV